MFEANRTAPSVRGAFRIAAAIMVSTLGSATVYALDAPHDLNCNDCHKLHNAPGGTITKVAGNANQCQSCHNPVGLAANKALLDVDQAVPGTGGTSHRWDALAINSTYETDLPAVAAMLLRLDQQGTPGDTSDDTIMCSTCHDQHNNNQGTPFLRVSNAGNALCKDCHAARDVGVGGGSHPVGVPIPGAGYFQSPSDLDLEASNVECLTCHGVHFAYSAASEKGTADSAGTTTALNNSTAGWTPDALVDWKVKILSGSNPRALRDITGNTATQISWADPLANPTAGGDTYRIQDATGSGDGYLLKQTRLSICGQCHTWPTSTKHLDTATGALWPGGQYGTDYPSQTIQGACQNCHAPHGWVDPNDSPQKFQKLGVEQRSLLCQTCHDMDGQFPVKVLAAVQAGGNAGDDGAVSGGSYSSSEYLTYSVEVTTGGAPGAAQITTTSTGTDSSGPTTVTAFDAPIAVGTRGVTILFQDGALGGDPPGWNVGAAVADSGNTGDDTATSGGTFTGTEEITYTVEVTQGGTFDSGSAQITCTSSTGTDDSGPTVVDAEDTPFPVGALGVTISFNDPSGGGKANQELTLGDKWTIAVTWSGGGGDGVLTAGDKWEIDLWTARTAFTWTATPFTLPGTGRVVNTHHDVNPDDQTASGAVIACGDCHNPHLITDAQKIIADPDPADGRSTAAGTSWAGSTAMSEFCLACHDDTLPANVTAPTGGLIDIYDKFVAATKDKHGVRVGNNPGLRAGSGYVIGEIMQCTDCHDFGHGTKNLFMLKETIYTKDGTTPLVSDAGTTKVSLTDGAGSDPLTNPINWCSTCHPNHMGYSKGDKCFTCHYHGSGKF